MNAPWKYLATAPVRHHGADTDAARPLGAKLVVWVGTAAPSNAKEDVDLLYDPSDGSWALANPSE